MHRFTFVILHYMTSDDKSSRMTEMGNIEKLIESILEIIKNDKLRLTLGYGSIKHSRKYGWSKLGQKIYQS